ncbi:recombination protein RecR [Candidatus Babeliales bacterium]|nr:recombination protein RecR [Candidatus Babeliales bacterium]
MIDKLPTIKKLMRQLQQVPFLASKNLYRVSSYFLHLDQQRLDQFCKVLQEAHAQVILCQTCFVWQEKNDPCVFCSDQKRDQSIICVVESWHELLVIERTQAFRGVYHVLGGVISPLEGVHAKDLKIDELIARVDDSTKEIIFSMNQTPEGEATAAFIARRLQQSVDQIKNKIKITCLAKGIPIGSNLEFVDRLTVGKALAERKLF